MRIPVIQGVIDRRMLVNFRVRPDTLAAVLPPPFVPKLINGWGMAGICLIRLKGIRPRHMPEIIGMNSENAAHRIAVQWESQGEMRDGVYIVRRDSSSRLNTLAGGRLFPGVHHHATFEVAEAGNAFYLEMRSDDGKVSVLVDATIGTALPTTSIFNSLPEASRFFETGSIGYSPAATEGVYDGLELRNAAWKVEPLNVRRVHSSFFTDAATFPSGSVEFDCALLMRGIEHEWHDCGQIHAGVSSSPRPSWGDVA
jgi:hypothetical protein